MRWTLAQRPVNHPLFRNKVRRVWHRLFGHHKWEHPVEVKSTKARNIKTGELTGPLITTRARRVTADESLKLFSDYACCWDAVPPREEARRRRHD